MAEPTNFTYSTGVTVSYQGAVIAGVYACSVAGPSGPCLGRSSKWTSNAGSATVSFFGSVPTAYSLSEGTFAVSGGGASFSFKAYVESVESEFELNGVTRSTVSFTFIE
jgi:hypothetical protein